MVGSSRPPRPAANANPAHQPQCTWVLPARCPPEPARCSQWQALALHQKTGSHQPWMAQKSVSSPRNPGSERRHRGGFVTERAARRNLAPSRLTDGDPAPRRSHPRRFGQPVGLKPAATDQDPYARSASIEAAGSHLFPSRPCTAWRPARAATSRADPRALPGRRGYYAKSEAGFPAQSIGPHGRAAQPEALTAQLPLPTALHR